MPTPLSLPSELTIYSLGTLKASCLDALPKATKSRRIASGTDRPWEVDASAVNEVDAAGIQLLVALSMTLKARRRTVQFVNPSAPLINACTTLGVSSLLSTSEPTA